MLKKTIVALFVLLFSSVAFSATNMNLGGGSGSFECISTVGCARIYSTTHGQMITRLTTGGSAIVTGFTPDITSMDVIMTLAYASQSGAQTDNIAVTDMYVLTDGSLSSAVSSASPSSNSPFDTNMSNSGVRTEDSVALVLINSGTSVECTGNACAYGQWAARLDHAGSTATIDLLDYRITWVQDE